MSQLRDDLKKYKLNAKSYEKKGDATIIKTSDGTFVYKKNKIKNEILTYLKSRSFDYLPEIITSPGENFEIYKYINDLNIPKEQKILDLIHLTALLHSKTTHYKEIDMGDFEELYEDLDNNLKYLYGYYTDLITIIESKVYMSPSESLLARNISKIYDTISNTKEKLENWHELVKEKNKIRKVVIHGNLSLNHFLRGESSYLISWRKAKIDSPVMDLYRLYLNHALDFDFEPVFREYEKHYPLMKDEKELLAILISLPDIITLSGTEYEKCKKISKSLDKIYKTEKLLSEEKSKTWP